MGRADLSRQIQIGVETTPGTAVPANKLLNSMSLNLNFEGDVKTYKAQGSNFDNVNVLNRSWQTGSFEGVFNYNEIVYPLASAVAAPTITTPSGGTLSRQWEFLPKPRGIETLKTFSVEEGDEVAADISSHVQFRSLSFEFSEDEITTSGDLIARDATVGTLTATPTSLPQVIGTTNQIDVFMTTQGDLANLFLDANKVTDAISETFSIGEKIDPRFVHNTSFASFKDTIQKAGELDFTFMTEHNAQSRALKTAATANTFRWIGVRVLGPIIENSIRHSFLLTLGCAVTPKERGDAGGVYGYSYNCKPVWNSNSLPLGSAYKIVIINTLTSL